MMYLREQKYSHKSIAYLLQLEYTRGSILGQKGIKEYLKSQVTLNLHLRKLRKANELPC